jgi:hypothetical protein
MGTRTELPSASSLFTKNYDNKRLLIIVSIENRMCARSRSTCERGETTDGATEKLDRSYAVHCSHRVRGSN